MQHIHPSMAYCLLSLLTFQLIAPVSGKERTEMSSLNQSTTSAQKTEKRRRFVVHKHDATRLHYDLRLEFNRTLKSWALPKQPSSKKGIKRLALQQPDHKLSYIDFEGILPEGSYGAGTVEIWDSGTYFSIKRKEGKLIPFSQCLKNGQIEIWMEGEKLKGAYALIKAKLHGKEEWLFMKINDEIYLNPKKPKQEAL